MIYDYLLFENFILAKNHLFDVELIARMLQSQGIKVAIFDIYHQYEAETAGGIDIIHWQPQNVCPDASWMIRHHSKLDTIFKSVQFRWQQHRYSKEAKEFIENLADNFYCGSYHNGMSTVFFDIKKPCYWWGLRSDRLKLSLRKFMYNPLLGIGILRERRAFMRNPMQRLFVSNQIIMDEHAKLGIAHNRMVIREERCIDTIDSPALEQQTKNISFLVIGMLRPAKQVPFTISAYKKANIADSALKLVGRSALDYEKTIEQSMRNDARISRINMFLEYSDFNKAFQESHFVLFADKEGPSCITNGTMTEALINHRPIICPDYNPYKYYIEKYQVGIVYKSGSIESYSNALKKASELGTAHFLPAIDRFLTTILFDRVAKNLVESINKIENESIQS